MVDTQTIGYYGVIVCGLGFLITLTAERFFLKKYIKSLKEHVQSQKELIELLNKDIKVSNALLETLHSQNGEYEGVLRQLGLIKDLEKPKLHG